MGEIARLRLDISITRNNSFWDHFCHANKYKEILSNCMMQSIMRQGRHYFDADLSLLF